MVISYARSFRGQKRERLHLGMGKFHSANNNSAGRFSKVVRHSRILTFKVFFELIHL